ncbi:myosin light chain 3, skeletal muscle isoform-like [Clavelina lepadiformis]|uniref:EF-hand domain-containing protein n=1 Tax=Clavelina lepadiformis TaxID=159417 RepID=A0ABP0F0G4_CLALP
MADLTENQVEDIKEAFEIFSKTTELQICYDQVGNVLRALKFNPTEEDVMKVLGNPAKEEMSSKTLTQEQFLPIFEKVVKECEVGTYDDLLEGIRVFDKEGNGCVMGAEIRHVLRTLGDKMSVNEVNDVMDGSEDMNGNLNIEAFCKYLIEEKRPE